MEWIRRKRRGWKVLLILVGLVLLIATAVPFVVAHVLRGYLQGVVADNLNARLWTAHVSYLPPYTLRLTDVRLIAADPDGRDVQLMQAPRLELRLGRLPWRSGPVVIESLEFDRPTIFLLQTPSGLAGWNHLIPTGPSEPKSHPPLSQVLQLRRLGVREGQVVYQHQTDRPVALRHINLDLAGFASSPGRYGYSVDGGAGASLQVRCQGVFDLDRLNLDVNRLAIEARTDSALQDLPEGVREWVRRYPIQGRLSLEARADLQREAGNRGATAGVSRRQRADAVADRSGCDFRAGPRPGGLVAGPGGRADFPRAVGGVAGRGLAGGRAAAGRAD